MQHTRTFPTGVVASPHHLASAAGDAVLRDGGNAVDAAIAANAVLGVVAPFYCGPGGDLFAIVAEPDGSIHALESAGRSPAGATLDAVLAHVPEPHPARVPEVGALSVTVPGAVAGWAALLERFGTMELGRVVEAAVRHAEDGVPVSAHAASAYASGRLRYAGEPTWQAHFGGVREGQRFARPGMAAFLRAVAEEGPAVLYGGRIGEELVAVLAAGGSTMTLDDLSAHEVLDVEPLRGTYGGLEVLELPPPTQGVTALQSLGVADRLCRLHPGHDVDEVLRVHLQVEAVRGALVDRGAHVTDPDHMRFDPAALVAPERLDALAAAVDPARAAAWPPATPTPGGTAYLCAADGEGRSISLIQSNFMGFGSGVVLPDSQVQLQNRGAQFSLDPDHVNVVAPGKRTLHTLIPGMVLRDGRPELTFGTMGGDGQAQTHLQVLDHLRRGVPLQEAHAAWRFIVAAEDGLVVVEGRAPAAVVDGLRERGHEVHVISDFNGLAGHAHAIRRTEGGWEAASDPRAEGAAIGH